MNLISPAILPHAIQLRSPSDLILRIATVTSVDYFLTVHVLLDVQGNKTTPSPCSAEMSVSQAGTNAVPSLCPSISLW